MDVSSPSRTTLGIPALVRRTQALIQAGVPLSLLLDIGDEDGPHSQQRYSAEGGDAAWLLPRLQAQT